MRVSMLVLPQLLLLFVCVSGFGISAATGIRSASASHWSRIKPMYLVAVSQPTPPFPMCHKRPVILNLEAPPMQDELLPGGSIAMDRIFGGNIAQPHYFPYQAGLLLQRPKGLYWCGGSLISNEFVLTAAHCVDMAKRAIVFLGAHEIKNAKEDGQQRFMVYRENFIIFPTWNPKGLKNDIAIVRLPRPINFTDRIQPISLPKRSYEYRNFKHKLAIASGWGRYTHGAHAISRVLRYVRLEIVGGDACKRAFPLSYHNTNICTSGKFAKSTCNGDSGGPLVLQRKYTKGRILIGITSFGSIYGCDRGYPAAFTKVASYLDWISDETGIDPYHQPLTPAIQFNDVIKMAATKKRNMPKSAAHAHAIAVNAISQDQLIYNIPFLVR